MIMVGLVSEEFRIALAISQNCRTRPLLSN